jgi:uncharacterized protein YdeI (YjbR/CyaY-like superfamily)
MKQVTCATPREWRAWLRQNHGREDGVWLVFYKKATGKQSLDYDSALDEALCFGWIDSLLRRIDDERYTRKFTPRKPKSKWSPANKRHVERLIRTRRMTCAGRDVIQTAKANGSWDRPDRPAPVTQLPDELQAALGQNERARKTFDRLAPSFRKQYVMWIAMAKRPETRAKRVSEAVSLLAKGQKMGLR